MRRRRGPSRPIMNSQVLYNHCLPTLYPTGHTLVLYPMGEHIPQSMWIPQFDTDVLHLLICLAISLSRFDMLGRFLFPRWVSGHAFS